MREGGGGGGGWREDPGVAGTSLTCRRPVAPADAVGPSHRSIDAPLCGHDLHREGTMDTGGTPLTQSTPGTVRGYGLSQGWTSDTMDTCYR